MKNFIKNKLREHLLSENHLNNQMKPIFGSKIIEVSKFHNLLIVAKDNDNPTQHYLVLNVELKPNKNMFDYQYAFSIHDENNKRKDGYMYLSSEVRNWLPNESRKLIIPKVIEMTKDLINKNHPEIIHRKAMEELNNKNGKRYDDITDFLIRVGYKLEEGYPKVGKDGKLEWFFIWKDGTKMELNEETILDFDMSNEARIARYTKSMDESWNNFLANGGAEIIKEQLNPKK